MQAGSSKRIADETRRLYAPLLKHQLNESQLARPTFKLILELVTQLVSGGLLRDLFTAQDCEPARLRERRARLSFLDKLIQYAASNRQPVVGCVAARILDGQEPNKTLELLQSLAHVAHQRILARASSKPNSGASRHKTFIATNKAHPKRTPEVVRELQVAADDKIAAEPVLTKPEPRTRVSPKHDIQTFVDKISSAPIDQNLSEAIPQLCQALKSLHVHLIQANETRVAVFDRCQREMRNNIEVDN